MKWAVFHLCDIMGVICSSAYTRGSLRSTHNHAIARPLSRESSYRPLDLLETYDHSYSFHASCPVKCLLVSHERVTSERYRRLLSTLGRIR